MKRHSVFSYVLLILLSITLISIGTVAILSIKTLSDFIYSEVEATLIEEAQLIHNLIPENINDSPEPYQNFSDQIFENLKIRITLITNYGLVLADSHEDYLRMNNHSDRPEIIDALSGKFGSSIRFSTTLSEHMLYVSIPPEEKNIIVRIALSVDHIRNKFFDTFKVIIIFSIIILISTVIISILTANSFTTVIRSIKDISEHYARGDFSKKLPKDGPKEVLQLKTSINSMGIQLQDILNKESFQKNELKAMFNSMEDSIILLDTNLNIKEMNPSAEIFFKKKFSECKYEKITTVIRDETVIKLLQKSIRESKSFTETIYYNQGLEQYLQLHSSPISDAENASEGVLLVLHNLTRMKQLENMRKDFVANVSHELKTPITLINGFVETLIDGAIEDKEKSKEFLQVIKRHSRRINYIIDDLLILSNIEDKGTNIKTEEIVLYDIIFSAYTSALKEAEKQKINMEINCSDSIKITANPILMEQAIFNLINNAIKYSGEKSNIYINAKEILEDEIKKIVIEVIDNGKGMAADQLDRIFERFYRINRKQSKKTGGTGLGLSIVKHIVLAHSGTLNVKSEMGQGSSFTMTFPIQ